MTDNELIKKIISVLNAGLPLWDIPSVSVKQSFQPTNQGANSNATAYLFKLFDKRIGFVKKTDVWDEQAQTMTHTEEQWYETTFQITCFSIQNPADTKSLTASDIANAICSILQSDFALKSLEENGIRVLRVTDIRNGSYVDDKDRNEYAPSFDFILTHLRVKSFSENWLTATEFNINRV